VMFAHHCYLIHISLFLGLLPRSLGDHLLRAIQLNGMLTAPSPRMLKLLLSMMFPRS